MKYHIEVREVYGNDTAYKPELTITHGESFSRSRAHEKRRVMQRYTNSLKYKVVKNNQ